MFEQDLRVRIKQTVVSVDEETIAEPIDSCQHQTMHVDYSSVALRYDNNPIRQNIPIDATIGRLRSGARILEVGCGTGHYLIAQQAFFPSADMRWFGLDPSQAMLDVAARKNSKSSWVRAAAEEIPFEDGYFDYVVSRFSFHHFFDKERALMEMTRVMARAGELCITNFEPAASDQWWMYRYFPRSFQLDAVRFWPVDRIVEALKSMSLDVQWERFSPPTPSAEEVVHEVRNRETSHLVMISDDEYREGCLKLESDALTNPTAIRGFMMVTIRARRLDSST